MADASPNVVWHPGHLSQAERWSAIGARGATVWFTGLSGSGKSTVATAVEKALLQASRPAYVLDGDNIRHGLNGDLVQLFGARAGLLGVILFSPFDQLLLPFIATRLSFIVLR